MDNNLSGSPTGDQSPSPVAHTPGPWKVFWGKRKRHMFIGIGTETGEGITDPHFGIWRGDSEEAAANARLIAAAPEMLEALLSTRKLVSEAAMTGFNCRDGDWAERLFANQASLSAAIAKATSVSPDRSDVTQSQAVR